MSAAARRPLIVGYGNTLRGDDAVGWYVAEMLSADERFIGVDIVSVRQLAPELAADFAAASRVVLVDAAADGHPPGTIRVTDVDTHSTTPAPFTHHFDASTVAALARELFGDTAPITLVTVSLGVVAHQERISWSVAAAIPVAVETIAKLALESSHA